MPQTRGGLSHSPAYTICLTLGSQRGAVGPSNTHILHIHQSEQRDQEHENVGRCSTSHERGIPSETKEWKIYEDGAIL